MTDPISFDSTSPRFNLPLLYSGQAQKEVFVNEALTHLDSLLHCAIEGVADGPPASSSNGEVWLISNSPTGIWAGNSGALACREGGAWTYFPPRDGMRIVDRSTGQEMRFFQSWQKADAIAEPSGGSTVDVEARSAIQSLILALQATGVLPSA